LPLTPRWLVIGVDIQIPPEAVAAVRPRLTELFPGAQIQTVSERRKITSDMLAAFQMNLQALGIVALLVSAYLVYNKINISVIQRESLIGGLLSLGARPRQIFASLIVEGVWLGVIGGVIGLIFGYGLSLIASREVDLTLEAVFRLDPVRGDTTGWTALLASFALGIGFSALAAWLPAYRGSRVPVASLRRPGRSEFRPRVLYWSVAGALLFLGIFATCFALARHWQSPGPGYGSVAALVGILSALAPLAIWALAKLARMFHTSGPARLAGAAAREHILKLAVAVAALGIALSMAGAVSVMVHSFRTTVINWLDTTVIADIYIRPDSGANRLNGELEPELIAALRAHPLVDQALTIRSTERVFEGQLIRVGANEFDIAADRRPLSFVDGDINDLSAAQARGGVLVSEVFANRFNLGRGDSFRLGERALNIHGVFRSYASERGFVLMDTSLFEELFGRRDPSGTALYLKDRDANQQTIAPAAAMSRISRDFARYPLAMSLSTEIRGQAIKIFNQTFRLTYILQMIAGGIAALSVITTLTGLALERRREFATLQALGARPGLLDRAMACESQIIAWGSLIIALPGSVLLSLLLIHVINRYSFGWTIVTAVPYWDLIAAAAGITLLALAAALAPIRLIRKQNIARILKQD
ncbi:MAG: FtsX-like permease family protein, partial [Leptospirales bacterium]